MTEDNRQIGDSNLASKSVESSIKIDSISINLVSANEKTGEEKCEHFSIRGFVSEVRKKDRKSCWPFASDGDNNEYEEKTFVFPPLQVPRFKFWRCQNCRKEVNARCIADNHGPVIRSCCRASVGNGTRISTDYQQGPKPDVLDGKKVDGAAANLDQFTEVQPLPCTDRNDKAGISMRPKNRRSQEIDVVATVSREVISSLKQKAGYVDKKDDLVSISAQAASESNCQGIVNPSISGSRPTGVAGVKFSGKQKSIKSNGKVSDTGKENSPDQQFKELIAHVTSGDDEDTEGEPSAVDKGFLEGNTPTRLNVGDDASSDSAEVMPQSDLKDHSNEDLGGLQHRRKTRKVRLLTELLSGNGDAIANSTRTQVSPSNDTADTSAGVDELPIPDSQATNFKRGLGHGRKRKPHRDESWKPIDMSLKGDVEATDSAADTDALETAFAGLNLQTSKKSNLTKDRVDRSPAIVKKRKQKTLSADECLPSASTIGIVTNEIGNQIPDASKVDAGNSGAFELANDTFRTREMDLFPLTAQRLEQEHHNCKMKGKMHEVDDQQAFQHFWNESIPRADLLPSYNLEVFPAGSTSHPCHLAPDTSLDEALNLSLNSYMGVQNLDMKYIPPFHDSRNSSLTWQRATFKDRMRRKSLETKYVEGCSFTTRPAPSTSVGGVNSLSNERPAYGLLFPNEKQNHMVQPNIKSSSLMQQKDFSSTNSKGKIGGIQNSVTPSKDGKDRAGKGSEQGTIDDIPMEIVELMAKNQYERCLPDLDYNKRKLGSPNSIGSSQAINLSEAHRHWKLSLVMQEPIQKQIYQTKAGKNGVIEGVGNVRPTVQNPIDYFAQADRNKLNMQQEQAYTAVGFRPFHERRAKPSSGAQHSVSSSSKRNSVQAGKGIRDVPGKMMPSHTTYPIARSCNTCQSIPQQSNEAKQFWSSLMPNQMPFVYNFPQKGGEPSTNIDFYAHFPGSLHKDNTNLNCNLKFPSQDAPKPGKQSWSGGSETLSRARADYPFSYRHKGVELYQKPASSLDLYSNETIPAMHLLSLMDQGLQATATAPTNLDVNQKLLKRPPIAPCRADSGDYRTCNPLKLPPYGKSQRAEKSQEPILTIPKSFGVSGSSLQQERSLKKVANFISQAPQLKEKKKDSDACMQNNISKLTTSASTSGQFGNTCGSIPVHSMPNVFSTGSDPRLFPSQFHTLQSFRQNLDVRSALFAPVNHHRSIMKTEICTVNRNPADFNIPEARNMYMISGEDLKVGKLVSSLKQTCVIKPGRKKRQKLLGTVEEQGTQLVS